MPKADILTITYEENVLRVYWTGLPIIWQSHLIMTCEVSSFCVAALFTIRISVAIIARGQRCLESHTRSPGAAEIADRSAISTRTVTYDHLPFFHHPMFVSSQHKRYGHVKKRDIKVSKIYKFSGWRVWGDFFGASGWPWPCITWNRNDIENYKRGQHADRILKSINLLSKSRSEGPLIATHLWAQSGFITR